MITCCKFCHVEIDVSIDPDYAELGDPYKLVPLAACNRCADLRDRYRRLTELLKHHCFQLGAASGEERVKVGDRLRAVFRALLQRYMGLMEDWKGGEAPEWDEGILEALMASPAHYPDILKRISGMIKVSQRALL